MPGRRPLPDTGPSATHPGVYAALGVSALEHAQQIDPRILCAMYESNGTLTMAEAQEWSDEQAHSVSLRALAARIDRRERVFVQPWHVIDVITGKELARVADLDHEGVPVWLAEMVRQPSSLEIGPRPAVTVAPDDTIRPAPAGTVPAW
jgi:hypothetical protein